jgi:hypothetical protein
MLLSQALSKRLGPPVTELLLRDCVWGCLGAQTGVFLMVVVVSRSLGVQWSAVLLSQALSRVSGAEVRALLLSQAFARRFWCSNECLLAETCLCLSVLVLE